jgi:hypothetical protein
MVSRELLEVYVVVMVDGRLVEVSLADKENLTNNVEGRK